MRYSIIFNTREQRFGVAWRSKPTWARRMIGLNGASYATSCPALASMRLGSRGSWPASRLCRSLTWLTEPCREGWSRLVGLDKATRCPPISSYCVQRSYRVCVRKHSCEGVKVSRNSLAINHLLFADDTMFFSRTDPRSCAALITILKKYEEASGQFINLDKSVITFSSKTPWEAKRRVRDQLRILNEGGIGKYLGLPEHFGRKKRDIFAALVDRIRQRSHSWTSRFLSGLGRWSSWSQSWRLCRLIQCHVLNYRCPCVSRFSPC